MIYLYRGVDQRTGRVKTSDVVVIVEEETQSVCLRKHRKRLEYQVGKRVFSPTYKHNCGFDSRHPFNCARMAVVPTRRGGWYTIPLEHYKYNMGLRSVVELS